MLIIIIQSDREWNYESIGIDSQTKGSEKRGGRLPIKAGFCHRFCHHVHCRFFKPYLIEVDSSANTVGAALLQSVKGRGNRPIAFASQKLTTTQKAWSTIEKEAYAAIWALHKFRNWIFGQPTTVIYSDYNPLTYITATAKLMQCWDMTPREKQTDVSWFY